MTKDEIRMTKECTGVLLRLGKREKRVEGARVGGCCKVLHWREREEARGVWMLQSVAWRHREAWRQERREGMGAEVYDAAASSTMALNPPILVPVIPTFFG